MKKTFIAEVVGTLLSGLAVVLMLWGYDSWKTYRHPPVPPAPLKSILQTGSTVTVEGVDFARSPVSLILVSSPVCKYCQASKHFHLNLLEIAHTSSVPIYVAVPSRQAATVYLKDLNVSSEEVKEYQQISGAVSGTPTILAVDNTGHVRSIWSGMAAPADELEIVDLVKSHSFGAEMEPSRIDAPNYLSQERDRLQRKDTLDILNVQERDKVSPNSISINIPLQELPYRASYELDRRKLHVVDCTMLLWGDCDAAVKTLQRLRFDAATLGAGTYHARCEVSPILS